jgi:hypothetical protein
MKCIFSGKTFSPLSSNIGVATSPPCLAPLFTRNIHSSTWFKICPHHSAFSTGTFSTFSTSIFAQQLDSEKYQDAMSVAQADLERAEVAGGDEQDPENLLNTQRQVDQQRQAALEAYKTGVLRLFCQTHVAFLIVVNVGYLLGLNVALSQTADLNDG